MSAPDLLDAPHSLEAEQSVLGALMLDPAAFDRIGALRPHHFFAEDHRVIFQAALDCVEAGEPVDILTVHERVARNSDGMAPNLLSYLGSLAQNTPTAYNAGRYAEIVRERALEREILAASSDIAGIVRSRRPIREKVDAAQARIMTVTEERTSEALSIAAIAPAYRATLKARAEAFASGAVTGLRTGFADLDAKLAGLQPGDLIVLAGRPSMGKSALGFQIGKNAACDGKRVLLLSMEMARAQIVDRYLAQVANVGLDKVLSGEAATWPGVVSALEKLERVPLYIDDQPALTIMEARMKARALKRRHGLDLLVVDYLQLMSGDGDNRNAVIEEISRGLKALAKELSVPVLALSQLSRACEQRPDKRPMLSDLRDSGAIEQDADVVLFVYREEQYRPNEQEWRGLAEILVRKNRQGATGDVRMTFLGSRTMFADLPAGYEWPTAKKKAAAEPAEKKDGNVGDEF